MDTEYIRYINRGRDVKTDNNETEVLVLFVEINMLNKCVRELNKIQTNNENVTTSGNKASNDTTKPSYQKVPPKAGEPHTRMHRDLVTQLYWCEKFGLRSKTHGTEQHRSGQKKIIFAANLAALANEEF